jgi:4-carboxymuconolactone decarboxylase
MAESGDRYARGRAKLAEIHGPVGQDVMDRLEGVAPDMARFVVEWGFADVYDRPGLDLRTRQLATLAGLVVLGHAQPQLRAHVAGSLNVGCSPGEIVETIMQMVLYAGFPAALNALFTAKEVFDERGLTALGEAADGSGNGD